MHWPIWPAMLPGPNSNPRLSVQLLDTRGQTLIIPTYGSKRLTPGLSLSGRRKLFHLVVSKPSSGRKQHAPLSPFLPSSPLQDKSPGPDKPTDSLPQLSPWVSPYLCWQMRHALSLRHNTNPNTNTKPNPKPSLGASASVLRGLVPKPSRWGTLELHPIIVPDSTRKPFLLKRC